MNPKTQYILAELKEKEDPPISEANHENTLIEVGTAMIIVAAVK